MSESPDLDLDSLEVVEFSTSQKKAPAKTTQTKVDLIGETMTVLRPKDAVLFFAQRAVSDHSNDADRWSSALNLLNGTLSAQDRYRFLQRACDRHDPLNAAALWDMVGQLLERWSPDSKVPASAPIKVQAHPHPPSPDPVRIVNEDLDLDLVAHAPKDIILGITASAIAVGSTLSDQAWCIGIFLDAALERRDTLEVNQRLRDPNDVLDLEDVSVLVQQLIERWYGSPVGNRKTRRARASQTRRTGKTIQAELETAED